MVEKNEFRIDTDPDWRFLNSNFETEIKKTLKLNEKQYLF